MRQGSLGSSANRNCSKAWVVMSSHKRIMVITGVWRSTVLELRCTEFARIKIHGGKFVGQGNSRVENRVGLRVKAAVTRCGNTICSDVKDRLDVPNHDRIDSRINSAEIDTSTCLTQLVGIFKGSVLEEEGGISKLQKQIRPAAISMIAGSMSNSIGILNK